MNEWHQVLTACLNMAAILFFMACYIIGGRRWKWMRRFVGGIGFGLFTIGMSVWAGSFKWPLLALPFAYPAALCLGYGSDQFWDKVLKRAIYGASFGLIGLFAGIVMGQVYLGVVQFGLPILVCVSLGVFNPLKNAVYEEALIAVSLVIHVPFMV